LILIARINHARRIWLEVRAGNTAAIRFYRRAGFKTKGKRRHYYRYLDSQGQKVKEDALIMCYSLV
jgi:ribosomal protein S18 acetylase RimI-like enzyme